MASIRRLRALLSLAAASAVAWVPMGSIVGISEAVFRGHSVTWSKLIAMAPWLAIVGAVCGFFSGLVVAAAENRRSFEQLTYTRMATWGALGCMVIPAGYLAFNGAGLGLSSIVTPLVVFGALGAATAGTILSVARRAPELPSMPARPELTGR
jgi:hypothetical protein